MKYLVEYPMGYSMEPHEMSDGIPWSILHESWEYLMKSYGMSFGILWKMLWNILWNVLCNIMSDGCIQEDVHGFMGEGLGFVG